MGGKKANTELNSLLDISPRMTCKSRQPGGLVDAGGEVEPTAVVADIYTNFDVV
jgi:hypothetical protein